MPKPKRPWRAFAHSHHKALGVSIILILAGLAVLAIWLRGRGGAASSAGPSQTVQAGNLAVTLQLDDTTLGPRLVDVLIHDQAGQPVDANTVRLRFSMAEMDMGTIEANARPVGRGRFQAQGAFFTMAGRWAIEAIVARADQAPLSAAFAFPIAAPGEASGPLNPLAADQPTLDAGRLLYQANCAACHGAAGQGDGPAALGLRPRPGDFTQHMLLGKHTDGQVYLWIRDGYPNSAMQAWGQRLADQQIWQLVTYLRTFAQPPAPSPTNQIAQATTATPGPAPTAIPAAPEPLPPLIFTRARNVWRSDGSGRPPQQLTTLAAGSYAQYPVISPAGDQIAFVVTSQGPLGPEDWPQLNPETKLMLMRADGSDLQVLWDPERGVLGQPAWAPDRQAVHVAFADMLSAPSAPVADRLFQIVRVDPVSKARAVALENGYDLSFSRDGQMIAFLRWNKRRAAFTLNVAAPDGSRERELVGAGAFSSFAAPRFSPDGKQILFVATGGPPTDEQGKLIAERQPSPLDRLLGWLAPPAAEAHGSLMDLWLVNTDGTGLRRLVGLREDSPMGVFTSDGARIAVIGAGGIYTMNRDGSDVRKIDPIGDHGGLDWAQP
jgi:mono/diheme cytochrome c family protein/Tol biopolymer transport system component